MPIALQWQGSPIPAHIDVVQSANDDDDFLCQAFYRVYPAYNPRPSPEIAILSPLATGGAMAVYKLTMGLSCQTLHHLVAKIPRDRRIVYTEETQEQTAADTTRQLLDRLVALGEHLAQRAPGLFPRSGGVWHRQQSHGSASHLLIEEFIPGLSVERLKHGYEEQRLAGQLSMATYRQRCMAVERLAVAAFIRLWDALERRTFTSDPSPWNVLVQPNDQGDVATTNATIIDLHSLEEHADLTYVIQRLAAVYGMRQEIVEEVILPGVLDTLGDTAGRALLRTALPTLEAQAQRTYQNLGVDLQRPVLDAIRKMG